MHTGLQSIGGEGSESHPYIILYALSQNTRTLTRRQGEAISLMLSLYGNSLGNPNRDPVRLVVFPFGNIRSFALCGDAHLPPTGRWIHPEVELENQYESVTVADRSPMWDRTIDQYHFILQDGSQNRHDLDWFITIDRLEENV